MATIWRPCSACGATTDDIAILAKSAQLKQLICRKCGVRGPYRPDNEQAVRAWNGLHGAPVQSAPLLVPTPTPASQPADAEPIDAVLRLVPGGNPLFAGIPYTVARLKGHASHCIIETNGETILQHLGYTGGQHVFVVGPKIEEKFTGSFHTLRAYADDHDVFRIRRQSLDLWHRLNRTPSEHGAHFMRSLTSRVWYARYQDGPPVLDPNTLAGRDAVVLRIVIGNDAFREVIRRAPHQFPRRDH